MSQKPGPFAPVSEATLHAIRAQVSTRSNELHMAQWIRFTRSEEQWVDATFAWDGDTELQALNMIRDRIGWKRFRERFASIPNPSGQQFVLPLHVPYRIKHFAGSGPLQNEEVGYGKNVFMIFPFAVGLRAPSLDQVFGMELIDFSERTFFQVVHPCIQRCFINSDEILSLLSSVPPATWTYLYALVHEMGHFLGPWGLQNVDTDLGVLEGASSELSADICSFYFMQEIPQMVVGLFVTRILWYLRLGFAQGDADVAVAEWMLQKASKDKALSVMHDRIHLDIPRLIESYSKLPELSQLQNELQQIIHPTSAMELDASMPSKAIIQRLCRNIPTNPVKFGLQKPGSVAELAI